MIFLKRKVSQNIYLFSLTLSIIQYFFVFLYFFKSKLNFSTKILIIDFVIIILWSVLFIKRQLKETFTFPSIRTCILFFSFTIASFAIIKGSWFNQYLRLDGIENLFSGKTHIDSLYHSSIAESFITNGYPSIQINAPIFIGYHALSHAIIAFISKLLSIPCFITYNYVYPLIAYPLFIYLIQKVLLIIRNYYINTTEIYLLDYLLIIICILFNFHTSLDIDVWLRSESYCFSLILLLIYFCIIDSGYKKISKFDIYNKLLIIPIFIILLSFSKISTGFLFLIGIDFYLFRKKICINKNWIFIIYYLFIFILYYYLLNYYLSEKFFFKQNYTIQEIKESSFEIFHYVKHWSKNLFYSVLYYIIVFLPIILLLIFNNKKNYFSFKIIDDYNLILQTCFICIFLSCLPGLFIRISGGSASYFVNPAWTFSFILFIALGCAKKIQKLIQNLFSKIKFILLINSKCILHCSFYKIFVFSAFIFIYIYNINNINIYNLLKTTLYYRLDNNTQLTNDKIDKIKNMFKPSKINTNKNYIILTKLREETRCNIKDYCIYLDDNFELISKYDTLATNGDLPLYLIKPYLAISAYIGIPVINAVYLKNNIFFRGDDKKFGKYSDFGQYSLPPSICGEKLNTENLQEYAKKLKKNKIIILHKDGFKILNLQLDTLNEYEIIMKNH
ncbi:MAG: hypothetical protein PUC37_05355 [Spirochaetales bacterium]|nr:hypothetical protein [Spirochaetales bacterium]